MIRRGGAQNGGAPRGLDGELSALGFRWEVVRGFSETAEAVSLVASPSSLDACRAVLEISRTRNWTVCPRGGGYTYGDMILNDGEVLLDLSRMRGVVSWDVGTGTIVVRPGTTAAEIFETALPDNWTLPSCPGGPGITVGGAIANNVHGKDSWKTGNFGDHVLAVKLLTAAGDVVTIDRATDRPAFEALVGGMGMLGIVVEATLQLRRVPSPFVEVSLVPTRNVAETIAAMEHARKDADHFIAWIDAFAEGGGLGRGYVTKARWIESGGRLSRADVAASLRPRARIFGVMPARPTWTLLKPVFKPAVIRRVNAVHYALAALKGALSSRPATMSFPDYNFMHSRIPDLKHVYRPHGFIEFQPIIPRSAGIGAIVDYVRLCQSHGAQSLLCGVKAHKADDYMISFSGDGYSIPVDLQLRGRDQAGLDRFLRRVIGFVTDCGGRVFLAKNDFLTREDLRRLYPRSAEYVCVKNRLDPRGLFSSDMYRRLFAGGPPGTGRTGSGGCRA